MTTRPTPAEVESELDRLEEMDRFLEGEALQEDGLTGAIKALRERMSPGQVTSMARGGSLDGEELKAATVAADWMAGLSEERPSALFAV